MLKKIYDKDRVWFAVIWILVYVLSFANADSLSQAIGIPKLLTLAVGTVLSGLLLGFVKKYALARELGLCRVKGRGGRFLWFVPLAVISSVNFWNGLSVSTPLPEAILFILSMCFVGLLEEVIFRGLLFRGMCQTNVTSAIIVSSLTFGAGHIVNLLLGAPVWDTLLQLVYASAVGFCYTAVFLASGSILPCIISHAFVNSTSLFAREPSFGGHIAITLIQTFASIGYGLWLLRRKPEA